MREELHVCVVVVAQNRTPRIGTSAESSWKVGRRQEELNGVEEAKRG